MDDHDKRILDELLGMLGPQGVIGFADRVRADQAAFEEAKKVRLSAAMAAGDILRMYPANIARKIAHEWDLDPSRTKDQMIKDITGAMPRMIPHVIDEASHSEREAIRYIARRGGPEIAEARRALNDSLIQPEFTDPGDPHMFDSFMQVYVQLGILVVGVRRVGGRDRSIVTMASDVRRIVATHTGWRLGPDPGSDGAEQQQQQQQEPADAASSKKDPGMVMLPDDPKLKSRVTSIFKPDRVEIKPGDVIGDPVEAMMAYAITKYRGEFEEGRKSCPYSTIHISDDTLVFKQHMTWFIAEWINPATGTTIIEEFVTKFVPDRKLAAGLMQITELFFDRFEVREHKGPDIVVYGEDTRRTYRIVTANKRLYPVGARFEGRIHPHENKYKLTGITDIHM